MDETQTGFGWDSWLMARVGNAIDVSVDRVLNKPQYMTDPSQAYGVDAYGNMYRLGQMNGQVTATVNQNAAPAGLFGGISPWLIMAVVVVLVLESK